MSGKLFIISAPSGAGKTTLVEHALKRLQEDHNISRVVTYTTKEPRRGEAVEGKDYHFLSHLDFEKRITQGYFIEWSNAYGNYYGTPCSIVERMAEGESLILILDRAGAQQVKAKVPQATLIWVYTRSLEVLKLRLIKRASETPEQIERRLSLAACEIEEESLKPVYNFHVLNDEFYETLELLCDIFKKNLKKTF